MDNTQHQSLKSAKRFLYLSGLTCADCAKKIEDEINQIEGVNAANVNFLTQKLTIDAADHTDLPAITRQALKIANRIEPEIEIALTAHKPKRPSTRDYRIIFEYLRMGIGAILFAVVIMAEFSELVEIGLFVASYLLIGGEVLVRAIRNVLKGQAFDENFLMALATIGAFAIGEYPEGVAVMLFYQVGEIFQDLAVNRSRKSITALMDIRPDFANIRLGDRLIKVSPDEVAVGDQIVVRPGERIPLDGKVIAGRSSLDISALTGEAVPQEVEPETEVLSGSVNINGVLTIQVTRPFSESTVSRILNLVENASSKKAPTEQFITKFARYYTPAVVLAALALAVIPPLVLQNGSFAGWINRALIFLVVSCPCALVISIPLSFFGGIGGASRSGVLVKGSNYLEALNQVDTIVFDKTGTLTRGVFTVTHIKAAEGTSTSDLLEYAAHAEGLSNHPIAQSIKKAYGKEVDPRRISENEELPGLGMRAVLDGKTILAGNAKLMEAHQIDWKPGHDFGTVVYVAVDGAFIGSIVISDEVKPDSQQAINDLKAAGVRHIAMLTGDSRAAGERVARELGIDSVYTNLLPHQKVEVLEQLEKGKTGGGKLVFVGDGINDAPVLARADIGIAMGGLGSDAAIEAADIVLMTDEPSRIVTAIRIARQTRRIVLQNIVFALGVKAVILLLGALGIATMWEAVFGDVGVALIAILNATRAMRQLPGSAQAAVKERDKVTVFTGD